MYKKGSKIETTWRLGDYFPFSCDTLLTLQILFTTQILTHHQVTDERSFMIPPLKKSFPASIWVISNPGDSCSDGLSPVKRHNGCVIQKVSLASCEPKKCCYRKKLLLYRFCCFTHPAAVQILLLHRSCCGKDPAAVKILLWYRSCSFEDPAAVLTMLWYRSFYLTDPAASQMLMPEILLLRHGHMSSAPRSWQKASCVDQ